MSHSAESPDVRSARRSQMYGSDNLGALPLFSGNFINFGYWPDPTTTGPITEHQRTRSQQDMYRQVLTHLAVRSDHRVLEIGCGIGVGAALTLTEFAPAEVVGLDLSADQLTRAEQVNDETLRAHPHRLTFRHGSALALPWPRGHFDAAYSVEAAQHFEDLTTFAAEAHRVLAPGGRLAVASFFTPAEHGANRLGELIETVSTGVDVVLPAPSFAADLAGAGFTDVHLRAIGDHVWAGLDAWISQTEYRHTWARNWLRAYQLGLVDYYIVTATA